MILKKGFEENNFSHGFIGKFFNVDFQIYVKISILDDTCQYKMLPNNTWQYLMIPDYLMTPDDT